MDFWWQDLLFHTMICDLLQDSKVMLKQVWLCRDPWSWNGVNIVHENTDWKILWNSNRRTNVTFVDDVAHGLIFYTWITRWYKVYVPHFICERTEACFWYSRWKHKTEFIIENVIYQDIIQILCNLIEIQIILSDIKKHDKS